MGTPGVVELLIILGIVILLFGANRLPALARSLGRSTREFKKGLHQGEAEGPADEDEQPAPRKAKKSDPV